MSQEQASPTTIYNLITMKSNPSQRRFAFIIGAIVVLISLLSVPFVRIQLVELQAYQPAIFSTVICFELITAYVIYSQFKINRSPSVLVLVAAYLFSGGMSSVYILTFPRVFAENGLFHAGTQTSVWLYVLSHTGFPLAIALYMMIESKFANVHYSARTAKRLGLYTLIGVVLLIIGLTYITTHFKNQLPIVLSQGKLTPLFIYGLGLPMVFITLLTLIVYYKRTKASTVTSTWLCVAILASMLVRKRISRLMSKGETRHYECYVNPISGETGGTLRGHLVGFRDRTEEERIDELKNEFVSIISHEIRTPLSSIVGFIEILATRAVTEEKRAKYIETIHKESLRLSNLINDFLDLQRLDSGRQEFHFQSLDAVLLLREIVEQWQGKDDHEAELHTASERIFIQGDEDRLKQVFHNLISNAIKYSPGATKIDIYVETDNGKVLIKIQDYGLGIPADALDKLFTRFYRVDNSDRRKIGGTGLGLSIVKEIIEAHHGKVVVDTELGKGSIFIVQLIEVDTE
ncbi:MASE4 domain-containing protein [Paenibacillus frigoriresistens]|uniref:ATP-binding protein n=1 Tax=Paenibacillus alginolyticus TaxID=59839 RepID=UPI0015660D40|nr:ATP-binding protein [Paenibacillus frigoriresistens]NRF91731.1 MASE4 domain-containing protein [Paenibacillus frigoriresistens]